MKVLNGSGIAPGLAAGKAVYISRQTLDIPEHRISAKDAEAEAERYLTVTNEVANEVLEYLDKHKLNPSEQEIISTHLDIIRDPDLKDNILALIRNEYHNLARAIHCAYEKTILFFKSMENEMFAQRALDFEDVRERLLRKVLKQDENPYALLGPDTIPIFSEIHPSDVSLLARAGVIAYVCEMGSYTSHAAILSRALNIACVASIDDVRDHISDGGQLILDGSLGIVVQDPDDEALEFFVQKLQINELISQRQQSLKNAGCVTKTGKEIKLSVNIGLPEELDRILELNCDGVGLFRTEFIYLSRNNLPSEDEQFTIYRNLAQRLAPNILTIRTFDLGGDKLSHLIPSPKEDNPYLGNRGIRFSLSHPEVLRTQLRAILRASDSANIRIMFPMIIDVDDFLEAKRILKSCSDELYEEGYSFDYEIPVGTMVEIPSAALSSDDLARECDFLSIGTNDLVQYTLAVDRNNDIVNRYFIQHHPAVLKLIRATINNAEKHHRPISVCGEMASIPEYVPLLIGMGISELSVSPSSYFEVKQIIRNCDEKLDRIIRNFEFSTSLPKVDDLVYRSLKPYYTDKRNQ